MTSTTATILGIAWAAALGVACVALKVCLGRVRDRRRYANALAADLAADRVALFLASVDTFGDHEEDYEPGPLAAYYAATWNAIVGGTALTVRGYRLPSAAVGFIVAAYVTGASDGTAEHRAVNDYLDHAV